MRGHNRRETPPRSEKISPHSGVISCASISRSRQPREPKPSDAWRASKPRRERSAIRGSCWRWSRSRALADNGHTRVIARGGSAAGRVGVRLAPFGSDFFVLRAVAEHADLLGGKLVAIDGIPVERLRDSARTLTGGTGAHRDRFAPGVLRVAGSTQCARTRAQRDSGDISIRDA